MKITNYTFFFIRKSFGGLGLNFLKNFGHFGAKTFLTLSYYEFRSGGHRSVESLPLACICLKIQRSKLKSSFYLIFTLQFHVSQETGLLEWFGGGLNLEFLESCT